MVNNDYSNNDKTSFIKQLTMKLNPSSSKGLPLIPLSENKPVENNSIYDDWFEPINQQTLYSWDKTLMKKEIINLCILIKSDDRIHNQELIHSNKKIIFNDSERTRVKDRKAFPEFRNIIEKALNLYCEDNKITYKQGMNEVLAPFLFLTTKFNITLSYAYNLFSCFVKRYLTNFYIDEDLFTLKSSIGLLNILLRYHDPMLYYIFDFCCIAPEMYATNWILTLFFSKCSLKIAYCLIDIITLEDDELFIFFYLTAFLSYKKNEIISVEQSRIPVALSTLTVNSIEECEKIYILACEFKSNTPYSFRLYVDYLELFKFKKERIVKTKIIESLILMPFFPSEVLFYTYPDTVKCPNWKCKHFIDTKKDFTQTENECFFCIDKEKTKKSIKSEESELEIKRTSTSSSFAERINSKKSLYIKNQIMNPLMLTDLSIKKVNIMILDLRQEYNEGDEEDEKKSGFLPLTISPLIKDFQEKNVRLISFINLSI